MIDISSMPVNELITLSRYMYRVNNPIIDNSHYDDLIIKYPREGTFDDDPIPYELLKKYNLEDYIVVTHSRDKGESIPTVKDWDEILRWLDYHKDEDVLFSLKIDGINTEIKIEDKKVTSSLSRTGAVDYTHSMQFEANVPDGKYLAEILNFEEAATQRSSAYRALKLKRRVPKPYIFKNLQYSSQSLGLMSIEDFPVVPFMKRRGVTKREDVEKILSRLHKMSKDLGVEADGVVVSQDTGNDKIAIKVDPFGDSYYTSIVKKIIITRNSTMKPTVKVQILKKIVRGQSYEYVNCHNIAILFANKIEVGKPVSFSVSADGNIQLLRSDTDESQ